MGWHWIGNKLLHEPVMRQCIGMLTHWGGDKMAGISQTTLSNAFSWMKMLEFRFIFHWSLFLRVQLTIFHPALVEIMAWRRAGYKPLSEPMTVRLPTLICVTRPQSFNVSIGSFNELNLYTLHFLDEYTNIFAFHTIFQHWDGATQIARFMGTTWGPPGSCRPQIGPMLASWTLLSGKYWHSPLRIFHLQYQKGYAFKLDFEYADFQCKNSCFINKVLQNMHYLNTCSGAPIWLVSLYACYVIWFTLGTSQSELHHTCLYSTSQKLCTLFILPCDLHTELPLNLLQTLCIWKTNHLGNKYLGNDNAIIYGYHIVISQ